MLTHVTAGFVGLLGQEDDRLVQPVAVRAVFGEMAFEHEGHQAQRGAGNLVFAPPTAVAVLALDEVLQAVFDGALGGGGQLGGSHRGGVGLAR